MKTISLTAILLFVLICVGCDWINRDPYADTLTSGRIKIGVDETFKPVGEAELLVFSRLYQFAEITPLYHPEKDCFDLLLSDSVRIIIASRQLQAEEKMTFSERKIFPKELKIAVDAIALIINPANDDTVMSLKTLERIMTGNISAWNQVYPASMLGSISVVFDHKNSSIVRYMADSVARGQALTGNLYALDSNLDVVDYVAKHPDALGLIGVSWISDRDDPGQLSFLEKVKVVALSRDERATVENSYKPYQAYIFDNSYPLTREVFAINAEPRNGLATGFMAFLASDKGQRIILKSGILPAMAPVRLVNVREDI